MIVGLKSDHFDKYFNFCTKQYMVALYCIYDMYYKNVKIKLLSKNDKKTRCDIDINIDNKENVLWHLEKSMSDWERYKSLFNFNFGTRITWPLGPNYALTNPISDAIQMYTARELADELNKNKKSVIKEYARLLIASKSREINKTKLIKQIEESGEHLGYYKAICNKHKIKYDVIPYIQNMYIIHMLFDILDNPGKEEYTREEVVTLHNKLEIYRFTRKSNPTYYLIHDMLLTRFIYSIKLHKYNDEKTNKEKEIVLVNIICKKSTVNNERIKAVRKIVKNKYPKIKISESIDYLTR